MEAHQILKHNHAATELMSDLTGVQELIIAGNRPDGDMKRTDNHRQREKNPGPVSTSSLRHLSVSQPEASYLVRDGSLVPIRSVASTDKELAEKCCEQENVTGTIDTISMRPVTGPPRGLFAVFYAFGTTS